MRPRMRVSRSLEMRPNLASITAEFTVGKRSGVNDGTGLQAANGEVRIGRLNDHIEVR